MDIKLTASGDLDLSTGDLQVVEGRDETAQRLRIVFNTNKGEWFLDDRVGMPYTQSIFVKNPQMDLVRSIYRQMALKDDGVDRVDEVVLEFDSPTRTLTVALVAADENGDTIEFGTLPVVEL